VIQKIELNKTMW